MKNGASVFNNFFKDSKFELDDESVARVKRIINLALELGINYFDVAPWYGNAQWLLAQALKEQPRDKYYLATKIGRYNSDRKPNEWFDFSARKTRESVEESLKLFGVEYIDLIQVEFDFKMLNLNYDSYVFNPLKGP